MSTILNIEMAESQYGESICLEEYNGRISVVAKQKGYVRMVHPSTKNGPSEKKLPMQVTLGSLDDAIRRLSEMVSELESVKWQRIKGRD